MRQLHISMDWPSNILHAGILLAQKNEWYAREGLAIKITSTADDICRSSPLKSLVNGSAHVAIVPSESLVSFRTQREPFNLIAIGAILQHDSSALVTHKIKGIQRPRQLDGKIYLSYRGRFENAIIRQMIINDGGCGMLRLQYPDKYKAWDEFIAGKADSIWVHTHREGLIAKSRNVELNYFKFTDYGIPYGYNPILVTTEKLLQGNPDIFRSFLKATSEGYTFASQHPSETIATIQPTCPFANALNAELLEESIASIAGGYLDANHRWGYMDQEVWHKYLSWMDDHHIVTDLETKEPIKVAPLSSSIFTNAFLPNS